MSKLIHQLTPQGRTACGHQFNADTMVSTDDRNKVSCIACRRSTYFKANNPSAPIPKNDPTRTAEAVTAKEMSEHIDDLKITDRQKEFVKAAMRALISAVLSKRFNARIDI